MVISTSTINNNNKLYQDFVKVVYAELRYSDRTDGEINRIAKGLNIINDEYGSDTVRKKIVTRSVEKKTPDARIVDMGRHACDQINESRFRRQAVEKPVVNKCVAPGIDSKHFELTIETYTGKATEESIVIETEEEMPEISKNRTVYLDLYQMNPSISTEDISKLLSAYSDIESISMPIYTDDETLKIVADLFPNIKSIDVRFCRGVTIEGIRYIAQKCLSLKYLSLAFSDNGITNNHELHEVLKGSDSLYQLSFLTEMTTDFDSAQYFNSKSLKRCVLMEPDSRYYNIYNLKKKAPSPPLASDNQKEPSTTSNLKALYKKVKEISGTISGVASKLFYGFPENEKKYFDRQVGYWNSKNEEKKDGIVSKLVEKKDQREHWYKVTPYVAEFWCTLSNLGFIYVGINRKSPELVFAGLASAASHTNPKKWLLTVDKIGAFVAVTKLLLNCQGISYKPWLITQSLTVGVIFVADTYLAHLRPTTLSHVTWHLSSAYIADRILKNI